MKLNKFSAALLACTALAGATSAAHAGSELTPGISTGLALGAALPEGLYNITIPLYSVRTSRPNTHVAAAVPAWLIWSTPWTVLGGRIGFDVATPVAHVGIDRPVGISKTGWLNPLVETTIKWDLGGGFHFGLHEGVHLPVTGDLQKIGAAYNFASFQQVVALSYLKDGWNVSASGVYGTGKTGTVVGKNAPSWANIDLTATKTFGKWEVGAVAHGSTDLSKPNVAYKKQSQFAVGGLVGYNFGPVIAQFKLTTDLTEKNYGGKETRGAFNIIIPLWAPDKPPVREAIVRKG
jgi:hypothetical protein